MHLTNSHITNTNSSRQRCIGCLQHLQVFEDCLSQPLDPPGWTLEGNKIFGGDDDRIDIAFDGAEKHKEAPQTSDHAIPNDRRSTSASCFNPILDSSCQFVDKLRQSKLSI